MEEFIKELSNKLFSHQKLTLEEKKTLSNILQYGVYGFHDAFLGKKIKEKEDIS